MSGLGGLRVTYLNINFGSVLVRPNGPWAGLGEILKCRPVETSTLRLGVCSSSPCHSTHAPVSYHIFFVQLLIYNLKCNAVSVADFTKY